MLTAGLSQRAWGEARVGRPWLCPHSQEQQPPAPLREPGQVSAPEQCPPAREGQCPGSHCVLRCRSRGSRQLLLAQPRSAACSGQLGRRPGPDCSCVSGEDGEAVLPSLAALLLNSAASLPHVISRMGKLEQVDVHLFCLVATDFYRHQIQEELDRRAFQSVFEVVAAPGNPYHRLLACLQNVHKVAAC